MAASGLIVATGLIKRMKQNNISVNADLTKQRMKESLRSATKDQRDEIELLTGLKRISINRVYSTGSISAKIAVAAAQTLNINPFYLTGESEEKGTCDSDTLKSFLEAKGYGELHRKASRYQRKPAVPAEDKAADEVSAAEQETPLEAQEPVTPLEALEPETPLEVQEPEIQVQNDTMAEMTEEEASQLLHALFIRSKYSENAKGTLAKVKALLV